MNHALFPLYLTFVISWDQMYTSTYFFLSLVPFFNSLCNVSYDLKAIKASYVLYISRILYISPYLEDTWIEMKIIYHINYKIITLWGRWAFDCPSRKFSLELTWSEVISNFFFFLIFRIYYIVHWTVSLSLPPTPKNFLERFKIP